MTKKQAYRFFRSTCHLQPKDCQKRQKELKRKTSSSISLNSQKKISHNICKNSYQKCIFLGKNASKFKDFMYYSLKNPYLNQNLAYNLKLENENYKQLKRLQMGNSAHLCPHQSSSSYFSGQNSLPLKLSPLLKILDNNGNQCLQEICSQKSYNLFSQYYFREGLQIKQDIVQEEQRNSKQSHGLYEKVETSYVMLKPLQNLQNFALNPLYMPSIENMISEQKIKCFDFEHQKQQELRSSSKLEADHKIHMSRKQQRTQKPEQRSSHHEKVGCVSQQYCQNNQMQIINSFQSITYPISESLLEIEAELPKYFMTFFYERVLKNIEQLLQKQCDSHEKSLNLRQNQNLIKGSWNVFLKYWKDQLNPKWLFSDISRQIEWVVLNVIGFSFQTTPKNRFLVEGFLQNFDLATKEEGNNGKNISTSALDSGNCSKLSRHFQCYQSIAENVILEEEDDENCNQQVMREDQTNQQRLQEQKEGYFYCTLEYIQ